MTYTQQQLDEAIEKGILEAMKDVSETIELYNMNKSLKEDWHIIQGMFLGYIMVKRQQITSDDESKICPKCKIDIEGTGFDQFGCWLCGYFEQNNKQITSDEKDE